MFSVSGYREGLAVALVSYTTGEIMDFCASSGDYGSMSVPVHKWPSVLGVPRGLAWKPLTPHEPRVHLTDPQSSCKAICSASLAQEVAGKEAFDLESASPETLLEVVCFFLQSPDVFHDFTCIF